MRISALFLFGLLYWQAAAPAQTLNDNANALAGDSGGADRTSKTGVIGADTTINQPTYAPLTASERWRMYIISAFGPEAIVRAAAAGGIDQWKDTPKEWREGSEAFGERFGTSLAEHVIFKTLESGAAAALHEDNRYYRSTDTGVGKRLKHAVGAVFVAHTEAGGEHFAFSRFGGAIGSAFISREWQPRSTNSSGDAAVTFGITMAVEMGWNVFKEFRPKRLGSGW
jgi:hypothetical protein